MPSSCSSDAELPSASSGLARTTKLQLVARMKAPQVKHLGEELLREPVKRVNNVSKLLTALSATSDEAVRKIAIQYLKLFFLASFERGSIYVQTPTSSTLSPEDKLHVWLKQKFDSFCGLLQGVIQTSAAENSQVVALNAIMELVRGQRIGMFDHSLFNKATAVLLQSPTAGPEVLQLLFSKYMPFTDVRFYTLQAICKLIEDRQPSDSASPGVLIGEQAGRRIFEVLSAISPTLSADSQDDAVQSWCGAIEAGVVTAAPARGEGAQQRRKRKREQSLATEPAPVLGAVQWANPSAYKKAFSEAWLGLLRFPLPSDLLKKVLVQLHSNVMPHTPNPLLLSDFLSSCLDEGGLIGMLALNGIFTLVTKHGLEYPHFYARLYALLQAPVFRAKYRVRFLQLADIFLSSGMVPAYTAAAFIKKFARLALTAPPAGAVIAVAFIHNLLRRHPSCSVLLNKPLSIVPVASSTASLQPVNPHTAAANPAASAAFGTVVHNSLPHTLTNGHSKERPLSDDSSDESSSQQDEDDSSDAEAAAEEADGEAAENVSQIQEATTLGVGILSGGDADAVGQDVFDERETDPAKCRAIESSLWELESLRQHYYHTVATYVSILDKDLGDRRRTAEVDVSALLRSSYSEYIVLETEKRLKSVPVAFYASPPTQLFPDAAKADFLGWAC